MRSVVEVAGVAVGEVAISGRVAVGVWAVGEAAVGSVAVLAVAVCVLRLVVWAVRLFAVWRSAVWRSVVWCSRYFDLSSGSRRSVSAVLCLLGYSTKGWIFLVCCIICCTMSEQLSVRSKCGCPDCLMLFILVYTTT